MHLIRIDASGSRDLSYNIHCYCHIGAVSSPLGIYFRGSLRHSRACLRHCPCDGQVLAPAAGAGGSPTWMVEHSQRDVHKVNVCQGLDPDATTEHQIVDHFFLTVNNYLRAQDSAEVVPREARIAHLITADNCHLHRYSSIAPSSGTPPPSNMFVGKKQLDPARHRCEQMFQCIRCLNRRQCTADHTCRSTSHHTFFSQDPSPSTDAM